MNKEPIDYLREDVSEIRTDVAVIKNTIEANHKSIRASLDDYIELTKKHEKTLYGNGDLGLTARIANTKAVSKIINNHIAQYRWVMGIIITLLLGLLTKIFML